jgi:hypothetical protein
MAAAKAATKHGHFGGFFFIEPPPVIDVFADLHKVEYVVNCPNLMQFVPIGIVRHFLSLLHLCRLSEGQRQNFPLTSWCNWKRVGGTVTVADGSADL